VVLDLRPSTVLIGSTRIGAQVAARLAQRLRVASVSECQALELDEVGDLVVDRLVHGGRFVARCVLHSVPRIAAVQPKRFEPLPPADRRGAIRDIQVRVPASPVNVLEVKEPEHSEVDIGKAMVVVAAGRGVRSKQDLALLESLARALGGELAGSRPLVDIHWMAPDRLVGISGRTVKPRLYLACGVSGQIEHVAGMRHSRTVVAININADAPIHRESDYSIVDDLYKVIPALVAAVAEGRAHVAGDSDRRPAPGG
jgi:electron transfer flavoprotein alpha subunit